ncbi:hypothetical protein SEA_SCOOBYDOOBYDOO_54 [Mycobacterium phage ScoobyDoobyDoo]|nr:hypothetical protein SEA_SCOOBYDOOBYDOO_54 [Mycobacterium phage ScoobyDoobyDoo]
MAQRETGEQQAYRMFLASVPNHRMIVLKDEGLYRHIRFQKPGTSIYRFDLVTWPGHLVVTGDLQDYHFARIPDMFDFFDKKPGYVNPHYWAEKLVGHHQLHMRYSSDRFKQRVFEYFREWDPGRVHERHADLWKAIREELLDDAEVLDENEAHRRLQEFRFRFDADTFEFIDSWEWDLREFDHHFLVSLHAIVWGIHQYRTQPHKTELDWSREDHARTRAELANLKAYHNV